MVVTKLDVPGRLDGPVHAFRDEEFEQAKAPVELIGYLAGYQFEEDDLVWDHLLAFEEGVKSLEQGDLPNTTHLQQHLLDHMELYRPEIDEMKMKSAMWQGIKIVWPS
ncbi:UNVERIFIED_CONTAM: hypothetical protein K2H54_025349 [Gekko kuhli]